MIGVIAVGRCPTGASSRCGKTIRSSKATFFTFARIRYTPHYFRGWDGDFPEADWNISYRLQELTSLEVNPNPVVLDLTDPELFDHPFIFIIAPRSVIFTDAEAVALRRYLLNGGFLMVDEFWGTE